MTFQSGVRWCAAWLLVFGALGCGSDEAGDQDDGKANQEAQNGEEEPANQGNSSPNQNPNNQNNGDQNQQDPPNQGQQELSEIEVVVEGLEVMEDEGLEAEVKISGEEFEETTVIAERQSFEVKPGTYEVEAFDIEEELFQLEGETQEVTVAEMTSLTVEVTYELVHGELVVAVGDHPSPGEFEAQVEGPQMDETVVGPTTLDELIPGEYAITYATYVDDELVFSPMPVVHEVTIASGDQEEVSSDYELREGTLEVVVQGLEEVDGVSVEPDVEVVGTGWETTITESGTTTLDLPVGAYEIEAATVEEGVVTYEGMSTNVAVEEGSVAEAIIDYELVYGELMVEAQGHPEPSSFEATVEGPAWTQTLDEATTLLEELIPGEYTVEFESGQDGAMYYDPEPAMETVVIASGDSAEVTSEYAPRQGTLEVDVVGWEADGGWSVTPDVVVDGSGVTESISQGGTMSLELPVGDYEVEARDVEDGLALFEGEKKTVSVELGSTTSVTMNYELLMGSLTVGQVDHPQPSSFEATVNGPELDETIGGESEWSSLIPGEYTVEFEGIRRAIGSTIRCPIQCRSRWPAVRARRYSASTRFAMGRWRSISLCLMTCPWSWMWSTRMGARSIASMPQVQEWRASI